MDELVQGIILPPFDGMIGSSIGTVEVPDMSKLSFDTKDLLWVSPECTSLCGPAKGVVQEVADDNGE